MNAMSDVRNRSGYAEVAGVRLNYHWASNHGEEVASVRADILKNDMRIGGINMDRDGKLYISLDKPGITSPVDQVAIISQAINDAESIFSTNQ